MVAVLTLISGATVDPPLENERARRQALTCDSSFRGLVEVYYQDLGADIFHGSWYSTASIPQEQPHVAGDLTLS
jgi:hypothetical protein